MTQQLHLRKFDMSMVADDSVVVFIGKRNTGKSWLLRDVLYQHRNIPIASVISPTEVGNKGFSKLVPCMFIHEKYEPEIVDNVVRRQQLVLRKMEREKRKYGKCEIDPRAVFIMDDCMYNSSAWSRNPAVTSIFCNGRHFKLMFLLTFQYVLGVPPNLRNNVDYVFILRDNVLENRKKLWRHWAGVFPSFEMFCSVMDQCTENHECLVINNKSQSNKLEDCVFWYKAVDHGNFRVGAPIFWQMHDEALRRQKEAEDAALDDDDEENMLGSHLSFPALVPKTNDPKNKKPVRVRKHTD
jgi:hypothetical protein